MRYLLFIFLVQFSFIGFGQYSATPIILSLPMDGDTIQETEPLLAWQCTIANLGSDPRLNLVLTVAQVDEEQTATEAILENAPVFVRQNLISSSINYSEIDHELVEGVWYAWQVVLFFNDVQVQQSEVFKFIKTEENYLENYYTLNAVEDGSIIQLTGKSIYFTTREHGEFQLQCEISPVGKKSSKLDLVEVFPYNKEENVEKFNSENRYYKCDLSSLKLKKGYYRFFWKANENNSFTHIIEKI